MLWDNVVHPSDLHVPRHFHSMLSSSPPLGVITLRGTQTLPPSSCLCLVCWRRLSLLGTAQKFAMCSGTAPKFVVAKSAKGYVTSRCVFPSCACRVKARSVGQQFGALVCAEWLSQTPMSGGSGLAAVLTIFPAIACWWKPLYVLYPADCIVLWGLKGGRGNIDLLQNGSLQQLVHTMSFK